jgi:hypothetical protein
VFAVIDDHEISNNFAGGSLEASAPDARFFNESSLYRTALQVFHEYNPIQEQVYETPADSRTHGKPKLYRSRRFGRGAAFFLLDARSFRDRELAGDKVRSIYKSETYPPFCIGHVYNLDPKLAGKIREAFKTFNWKGTGLEKAYKPANQTTFVEVSYKKDWEAVRALDKAILDLVGEP